MVMYKGRYAGRKTTVTTSTKPPIRRKKPTYKPSKGVSTLVKKYVNRTIHRNVENKRIQYSFGFGVSNYNNDTTLNSFRVSPGLTLNISQGTGQGNRVGNRIRIMNAILTYYITPTGQDTLVNPQPRPTLIRIWIGYKKDDPANNITDFTQLYQVGNSSGPPGNFISDMQRPVNKDKFLVYRSMVHKIGFSAVNGTGGQPVVEYYNNNDFKYLTMRRLDITKYMSRFVTYNDGTNTPTTRGLYVWMQIVGADNTTMNNIIPCTFNYTVDISYEDA